MPSYNWIEVAETVQPDQPGRREQSPAEETDCPLFRFLVSVLPSGGHLMVEYDSPERAETARGLAAGIPAIVTPLGSALYCAGCGARFKDWQIAEGGSEGPRKLQAYVPPSDEISQRWEREAADQLERFLAQAGGESDVWLHARERARSLIDGLRS
jgi:hypothetical protein